MSANIFKIEGNPTKVESRAAFMALENKGTFSAILFYPAEFNEESPKGITVKNKIFSNVSFKDTTFRNVRFLDCKFKRCLFLSAQFIKCEFINCSFIETNTNKAKFSETLIDPNDFSDNFSLKGDTNIAADLYHSLYKNLSNERHPDRAIDSLYLMQRAENAHLSSQLERKKISKWIFFKKKMWHVFHNLTSGYGLKLHRVLITLAVVLGASSIVNYIFRDDFFKADDISTPIDAFYFTLVTLTTLGYGDISPCTQIGRLIITFETAIGIVIISLFLSSVASKSVRA